MPRRAVERADRQRAQAGREAATLTAAERSAAALERQVAAQEEANRLRATELGLEPTDTSPAARSAAATQEPGRIERSTGGR